MDIYDFISSKDIRNYLKEINYEFEPLEAAWVIWQNTNRTLEEKHNAWQEIIDTKPDVEFEVPNINETRNLHEYLKELIAINNELLDEFYKGEENAIYNYSNIKDDDTLFLFPKKECKYDDLLDVLEEIKRHIKRKKHCKEDILWFELCKQYADENKDDLKMVLTPNLEIQDISSKGYHKSINTIFESLWLSFPTPFRQGDIVWSPNRTKQLKYVVTVEKPVAESWRVGNFYAYSQHHPYDKGKISTTVFQSYLGLEYYNGELNGEKRILKALSSFLKGKIDVGLFANAYHHYMTESYCQKTKPLFDSPEEDLKLAGLEVNLE